MVVRLRRSFKGREQNGGDKATYAATAAALDKDRGADIFLSAVSGQKVLTKGDGEEIRAPMILYASWRAGNSAAAPAKVRPDAICTGGFEPSSGQGDGIGCHVALRGTLWAMRRGGDLWQRDETGGGHVRLPSWRTPERESVVPRHKRWEDPDFGPEYIVPKPFKPHKLLKNRSTAM